MQEAIITVEEATIITEATTLEIITMREGDKIIEPNKHKISSKAIIKQCLRTETGQNRQRNTNFTRNNQILQRNVPIYRRAKQNCIVYLTACFRFITHRSSSM